MGKQVCLRIIYLEWGVFEGSSLLNRPVTKLIYIRAVFRKPHRARTFPGLVSPGFYPPLH